MLSIKYVRHRLGLTQKQMAELMGMDQSRLSKIETQWSGRKETNVHLAFLDILENIRQYSVRNGLDWLEIIGRK